jgi:hypothetical protein
LAHGLGVQAERINTTSDFAAAEEQGVHAVGESEASTAEALSGLATFSILAGRGCPSPLSTRSSGYATPIAIWSVAIPRERSSAPLREHHE